MHGQSYVRKHGGGPVGRVEDGVSWRGTLESSKAGVWPVVIAVVGALGIRLVYLVETDDGRTELLSRSEFLKYVHNEEAVSGL